uniref:Zinc finger protein 865 n=1 Tax=Anopheles funestus TaxID=62324 RepID=A0A182S502_ANOFN
MDVKTELVSSAALELEVCRICATESVEQCSMDDVVDAERCLSLNTMCKTMFPTTFNQQAKTVEGLNWPTKACLACKEKVLIAYELYTLLVNNEDWLQRSMEDRHRIEVETVKTEQDNGSSAQYDVLIEYTFEDGNTYSTEIEHLVDETADDALSETPIAVEEQSENIEHVARMSTRRRNRSQRDVSVKKRTRSKYKQESVEEETSSLQEQSSLENVTDSLVQSNDEEESTVFERQPKGRKRGRKPKIKPGRSQGSDKEDNVREKKKRAKIKPEDDSSDHVEELQSKVDVYQCQLCEGHTYGSPMELTVHLKAEHPDQIRTCDKCPKVFMSEPAFQHHQYCHATLRSFFCMFCDKGFQTENLLKSHTRSHTHVAEFLCSLCGKKFNSKSNLRQHLVRHTGVKAWACTQCPSRFCTKGALNLHQRTHSKLRPFSCDTCGSQFHTRYSLIKHQLIHTGERPYGCDLCPMRFVSTYHVKRHMLTHTGEKPFKCTYCERGFAQSNDMVKHMKTHLGENPYQCDRCEASFRLLTELRNHYKETCQPVDKGTISFPEVEKGIRFTSTNILKMRYEKEMAQYSERYEGDCENRKVMAEATEFPAVQ